MNSAPKVLLVEDDDDFTSALKGLLERADYAVHAVGTARDAAAAVRAQRFSAVLLDFSLPDCDGLRALATLAGCDPGLPIIFLTGRNDAALAVRALRSGASDYLTKPVARDDVLLALSNASKRSQAREQLAVYRAGAHSEAGSLPVGSSPSWMRTLELIGAAARSAKVTVLFTGEPGVGKEIAASLLHRLSPRSAQPFVTANAACLSPNLIESELFGHEAGSFTGAQQRRRGLFEMAHGGTLFLDEIGELSLELQAKLLRIIEGHSFRRLGGEREVSSDARLIFATNRRLEQRVRAGQFRADLYDRLRVFEVPLPPLRERREDIPELVQHFAAKLGAELGQRAPLVSQDAMQRLCAYPWPGNVRELRNAIERAMLLAAGGEILPHHLPLPLGVAAAAPLAAAAPPGEDPARQDVSLESSIKRHITSVYDSCGRNVTRTAAQLGISRLALRKRLYSYGLRSTEN